MRLICGLLRLDGGMAGPAEVTAMAAAQTAPGLDPLVGIMTDGPLALAVLNFTGQKGGLSRRNGWCIAADVRLDRSGPDPEDDLLHAVSTHGPDFPDRLDGDFVVALWHGGRGELLLGRDYIGVRPLVWNCQPGHRFIFASLPKGLHASGLVPPAPDPVALGCQMIQTYFTGSDSGFADIAYLEAGHSLTVRIGDPAPPRPHRAYRPDPAATGRWRGTPEQAAAELHRLITEAVAARLPATGPVACHLTGGLDSSAITVLAARLHRQRPDGRVLATGRVTPNPVGPADRDERPLIAAVLAQEPDLHHHPVLALPPLPGEPQEPDWPGSGPGDSDDRMAAAAAAFGADRILSGVGGDEGASYNGANLYAALLRRGDLAALCRELPARARSDGHSLLRAVRDRLILPLLSRRLHQLIRARRGLPMAGDPRNGRLHFLSPRLKAAVTGRLLPPILIRNTPAERTLVLADHHIPSRCTFYAIAAARHGLAMSFPLLDRRVTDFILSLPIRHFLADGQSRQPFRRAMRGILPDAIRLTRHKVGLFDEFLTHYAAHKADLLAELDRLTAGSTDLLADPDAIRAGLLMLPDPAATIPPAIPVWLPLTAVRSLILARNYAGRQNSN